MCVLCTHSELQWVPFLGRNYDFWPKIEIFRNFDQIASQTEWSRSISMKCNSLVKASNNRSGHPDPNSLGTQPLPSAGTADHASGNHWPELAFCLARMDSMAAKEVVYKEERQIR